LAAERRPDVAELHPDTTRKLNVTSVQTLAHACKDRSIWFLYISTDYVFDGKNPPYSETSAPNPLNFYGKCKHEGEVAALGCNPSTAVLRVPVLYGNVEYASESAINILVSLILKPPSTSNALKMDHFQKRYPTK
jgi:S-adenosylmethionine synthetase